MMIYIFIYYNSDIKLSNCDWVGAVSNPKSSINTQVHDTSDVLSDRSAIQSPKPKACKGKENLSSNSKLQTLNHVAKGKPDRK